MRRVFRLSIRSLLGLGFSLPLCAASPVPLEATRDQARMAYASGQYDAAAGLYATLLEEGPQIRIEAAWTALQQGQPEAALALLPPLVSRRRRAPPAPAEAFLVAAIAEVQRCNVLVATHHAEAAHLRLTQTLDRLPPGTAPSSTLLELLDLTERAWIEALSVPSACSQSLEWDLPDAFTEIKVRRLQALALLEARLERSPPTSPEIPALLLRLAALQTEIGDAFVGYFYGHPDERTVALHSERDRRYSAAIALYQRLVRDHPATPEAEQGLYLLGRVQEEAQQHTDAVHTFQAYVQRYPQGVYLQRAYLDLGEHAFAAMQVHDALDAYQHVIRQGTEPLFTVYAHYKRAWCLLYIGEHGAAMDALRFVLAAAGDDPNTLALQEEAQRDIVQFYAIAGDLEGGRAEVDALADPVLSQRLRVRLANLAEDQGLFSEALETYAWALAWAPLDGQAPACLEGMARIHRQRGEVDAERDVLRRLLTEYGPGSAWDQAHPQGRRFAQEYAQRRLAALEGTTTP